MNPVKYEYVVPPSQCYLNKDYVLELLADDLVLVQSLLMTYLQARGHEIEGLKRAIDACDPASIRVRAHRLRGLLRYFGAQDLEDMLLEMEVTHAEAEQPELQASYRLFLDATHILEQEIHDWLDRLGTLLEPGAHKEGGHA